MTLTRFVEPQQQYLTLATQELTQEEKRSHWMWFMFPQLKGLGRSYAANFYGIDDRTEAVAFLADPYLGHNLRQLCQILLQTTSTDATAIFGYPDDLKLRSSLTLFDAISPNDIFATLLQKFFEGKRDEKTLMLLH